MKHKLIIFSGPSGVGKGAMLEILKERRDDFVVSVSCTTRAPRATEIPDVSYHYITDEEFLRLKDEGYFLEWDGHFGGFYGTPKDFVFENLKNKHVILEIEVNGALKVRELVPDCVLVMVLPPSREELRRRLEKRKSETPKSIEDRLARYDYEVSKKHLYDYVIINDVLPAAADEFSAVLDAVLTE